MTLNDLGNIGELVGGIGVAISLLYLAVQIRHSSQISRFDAHRSLSDAMASIFVKMSSDPELYRIWRIMTESPQDATYEDRERFGMLLYQFFTTMSDAVRFGRMDRDLQVRYQQYLYRFLNYEAVRAWWSRQGGHYGEQFQSLVEKRLREIATETG